MIDIEAKCKLCQRPLFLKMDPDCEERWKRVFLSMLTCDRCFDLRETRLAITGKLQALAQYITALDVHILKPEDRKAKRSKARDRLLHWTRKYAEWLALYHGVPRRIIWDEDFADLILDAPGKLDEILRQYRKSARPVLQQEEAVLA
jgi:hypothetical protein